MQHFFLPRFGLDLGNISEEMPGTNRVHFSKINKFFMFVVTFFSSYMYSCGDSFLKWGWHLSLAFERCNLPSPTEKKNSQIQTLINNKHKYINYSFIFTHNLKAVSSWCPRRSFWIGSQEQFALVWLKHKVYMNLDALQR